ncbi:MAG: GGDEF and EAL domain-containing protein [Oleiphilaceae bacterium]|nr:GGDEF and EAL domain-containing protein [Oleiphilaceae bacterium]
MDEQLKAAEKASAERLSFVLRQGPRLITLGYLLLGFLWIVFSDALVATMVPGQVQSAQTWKGIGFVLLTGALLYLAMNQLFRAVEQSRRHQQLLHNAVQEREARFVEMARHIPEVFWTYQPATKSVSYASPAFEALWGQSVDALVADPGLWMRSVHPEDRDRVRQSLDYTLQKACTTSQEYRIRCHNGQWRWVHDRVYPILDQEGQLQRLVGVTQDITQQHQQQQALYHEAHYDRLTGLPNRALFHERLGHQCLDRETDNPFVLMVIDLDRFKTINDSLGYSAGDELLRQVAQRLQQALSGGGFIARLGADEFAVLLSRESESSDHKRVATELVRSLSRPYRIQQVDSYVTVSIGVALFPCDGGDPETLLKNADVAMFSAKEQGRNTIAYFHQESAVASAARLHLEMDIHQAVAREEFELYYQAQFDVPDRRLVGAECLLRWNHPEQGMISPGAFIPLLEETGLIKQVGLWVIERACRDLGQWTRQGLDDFTLAVNMSARQLYDAQLPEAIERLLARYQVPRNSLELELTESSLIQEPASAQRLFQKLREMGVRIAIDDFGTGYSSLNYLKTFAPDLLKIDKSFVDGITSGLRDRAIFTAIVDLAHTLEICVIAEGVEEEAQMDSLRHSGCDWVQGFLLARPQPASVFVPWLVDQRGLSATV